MNQRTELGIDVTTIEVFGLELEIGVELIDRVPEGLRVPNDLAHGCLIVRRQQAVESPGNHGHRLQRDMVALDHLHVRPCPATIFGWGGAFATRADRMNTTWIERHDRFEAECTLRAVGKIVDVGQTLSTVQTQC